MPQSLVVEYTISADNRRSDKVTTTPHLSLRPLFVFESSDGDPNTRRLFAMVKNGSERTTKNEPFCVVRVTVLHPTHGDVRWKQEESYVVTLLQTGTATEGNIHHKDNKRR